MCSSDLKEAVSDDSYQVQRIRTDTHSPTRFRVDGSLTNIPEFAEAFKCSKKAKVSLWFAGELDILLPL